MAALHGEVMIFAWELNQDMFKDLSSEEQSQLLSLLDKLFQTVINF